MKPWSDYEKNFVVPSYVDLQILDKYRHSRPVEQKAITYNEFLPTKRNTDFLFRTRSLLFLKAISSEEITSTVTNFTLCQFLYPSINEKTSRSFCSLKKEGPGAIQLPDITLQGNFLSRFVPVCALLVKEQSLDQYHDIFLQIATSEPSDITIQPEIFRLPSDFYYSYSIIRKNFYGDLLSNQAFNTAFGMLPFTSTGTSSVYRVYDQGFHINQFSPNCTLFSFTKDKKGVNYNFNFINPAPYTDVRNTIDLIFRGSKYNHMINVLSVYTTSFTDFDPNALVPFESTIYPIDNPLLIYMHASIQVDQSLTLNQIVNKVTRDGVSLNPLTTIYSNYLIYSTSYEETPPFTEGNYSVVYTLNPNITTYMGMNKQNRTMSNIDPTIEYEFTKYNITPSSEFSLYVVEFLNAFFYRKYRQVSQDNRNMMYQQYVEINRFWEYLADLQPVFDIPYQGIMLSSIQRGFMELFSIFKVQSATELGFAKNYVYVYLNCLCLEDLDKRTKLRYYIVPGFQFLYGMYAMYTDIPTGYYRRNFKLPLSLNGLCLKPFFGFSSLEQSILYLSKNLGNIIKRAYSTTTSRELLTGFFIQSVEYQLTTGAHRLDEDQQRATLQKLRANYMDTKTLTYLVERSPILIYRYLRSRVEIQSTVYETEMLQSKIMKKYNLIDLGAIFYNYAIHLYFLSIPLPSQVMVGMNTGIPRALAEAVARNWRALYDILQLNPELNLFFDSDTESLRQTVNQVNGNNSPYENILRYESMVRRYMVGILILFATTQFFKNNEVNAQEAIRRAEQMRMNMEERLQDETAEEIQLLLDWQEERLLPIIGGP